MENTIQNENELIGNTDNLKPEQMESGKWYVALIDDKKWVLKFARYDEEIIYHINCVNTESKFYDKNCGLCPIQDIKSIRHATKEEVLKYFPDEKFENVSLINEVNNTQVTEQQNQIDSEKVETDWKAKFEELQNRYELLITEAHKLDVLSGEMCDRYKELKQQVEKQNNQAKVYFYFDNDLERNLITSNLKDAVSNSKENESIYEAICIGKKKSVLVSE